MTTHSRAQIVATIGPASGDRETLKSMAEHQMNAARLNFAHGTFSEHREYIAAIRAVGEERDKTIVIIADLPGPRTQGAGGHRFDRAAPGPLTRRDKEILTFALEHAVDYITLSYVGSAKDMHTLHNELRKRGATTPVIAKVERASAVEYVDEIIESADALMIGRGDLANEVPPETIPFVQEDIIHKAKKAGTPVIVATQMLASMVENPEPTRAEVTDVSQAIVEGADAVMLSEETAIGTHPIAAVAAMERIVLEAERHNPGAPIHPL